MVSPVLSSGEIASQQRQQHAMTAIINPDAPVDRIGAQTAFHVAKRVRGLSDRSIAWLFVTPDHRALLAINIFPLIWMIRLSFTSLNLSMSYLPLRFVGIDNYSDILTDEDMWIRLQTTAQFVISTVVLQVVIGFGLALLDQPPIPLAQFLDDDHPVADDAVARRGRQFLDAAASAADRTVQLFDQPVHRHSAELVFSMTGEVALAPWTIVLVDTWMWAPYVMLICLAGLRSIPDYIYEAAEVDRASAWRQFWSITLPMAMPFLMLAVLFRAIENFKMFDMVNLLTSGGPGSTTELVSITLEAGRLREMAHRLFLGARHHPVRHGLWRGEHLRQSAQPGEAAMTAAAKSTAHSIVEASPRVKTFRRRDRHYLRHRRDFAVAVDRGDRVSNRKATRSPIRRR